jgi:hypothetical protein
VGIDQSFNPNDRIMGGASVRVTVKEDKPTLWPSGLVRLNMASVRLNADLRGIQELVLIVDDGGDRRAFDWWVWADPVIP